MSEESPTDARAESVPGTPVDETPTPGTSKDATSPAQKPENPLANILINVLVPVVVLNFLSKEHRLGPLWAMIVAVSLPIGYGIWFGWTRRKWNFFSVLGIVSIGLTGGLGLAGANALWFALKKALIPLIFGLVILGSHWTGKPLIDMFLLNPDLLDLPRIQKAVEERGNEVEYRSLRLKGTLLLTGSMFLSSVMNFFLAMYFLRGKEDDPVAYNEAIGKLTGAGFLVMMVARAILGEW